MTSTTKTITFSLCLFFLLTPFLVSAQTAGLVPCGNEGQSACTFYDIFKLIGNIIEFLLLTVAVPLCALVITWSGIQLALHPNEAQFKTEKKNVLWGAVLGLFLAFSSYLIVDTLLTTFTDESLETLQPSQ